MKKLTAGIFATLLAVVSVDGAYAAIASKGYVDEKVGTVTTELGNKADKTELGKYATTEALTSGLAGKLDTTGTAAKATADADGNDITTTYATKTELGKKADSATVTALDSAAEKIANRVTTVSGTSDDAHYPTAKAVWDVVQAETEGIASTSDLSALTTRVTTAEGEIDTLQTDMAGKANTADLGDLATLDAVGSAQITDGAVATADIASKAVTKEKLADDIVTSLGRADTALQQASLNGYLTKTAADTAYAAKTLEGQVGTVSKENMGTTTATTVVGGVKEAINAAKAAASAASTADGKAVAAQEAAEAAQATVDKKQDKLTQTGSASQPVYVDATGKVTAGNTIPTVTENITTGQTGAAQAGAVATALAAKANSADVYTKTTANSTFIPRPGTNCTETGAKCVLVTNGTGFEWEVIVRDGEGK